MTKTIIPIIVLLLSLSTVNATGKNEITAITETAMNYMEGWYQGDAKRMKASLHKKLAKRSLREGYGKK